MKKKLDVETLRQFADENGEIDVATLLMLAEDEEWMEDVFPEVTVYKALLKHLGIPYEYRDDYGKYHLIDYTPFLDICEEVGRERVRIAIDDISMTVDASDEEWDFDRFSASTTVKEVREALRIVNEANSDDPAYSQAYDFLYR